MLCPSQGSTLFWTYQIISVGYQSFWTGPNHFGQVKIIKISQEKSNLKLIKIIWTCPKQIGPDQKNLYPIKMIWSVQNNFGLIEGQGIFFFCLYTLITISNKFKSVGLSKYLNPSLTYLLFINALPFYKSQNILCWSKFFCARP